MRLVRILPFPKSAPSSRQAPPVSSSADGHTLNVENAEMANELIRGLDAIDVLLKNCKSRIARLPAGSTKEKLDEERKRLTCMLFVARIKTLQRSSDFVRIARALEGKI
jgi:hypothetical protein